MIKYAKRIFTIIGTLIVFIGLYNLILFFLFSGGPYIVTPNEYDDIQSEWETFSLTKLQELENKNLNSNDSLYDQLLDDSDTIASFKDLSTRDFEVLSNGELIVIKIHCVSRCYSELDPDKYRNVLFNVLSVVNSSDDRRDFLWIKFIKNNDELFSSVAFELRILDDQKMRSINKANILQFKFYEDI